MWKAAYFKELWRQQWDCVNGELGYRLCGVLGSIKFINDKHRVASGVAPYLEQHYSLFDKLVEVVGL